jgi:error-prone DNA polymerase
MKVHRAPEFYAGLLNNQPMGFYSPATLAKDAQRRGVRIRPVNVQESDWQCTVGDDDTLRLGLCFVRSLTVADGACVVAERARAPFDSLADFQMRTALPKAALRTLAKIGALNGLSQHRRTAQWEIEVPRDPDDLFAKAEEGDKRPLAPMRPAERSDADYAGTSLTTGPHPMALLREHLPHLWRAADLPQATNGLHIAIGGMVICRQRPGTAKGVVFISVEDETGVANAIVSAELFEKRRLCITQEDYLQIEGILQNVEGVIHVKARRIEPFAETRAGAPASHDFR